MKRYVEMFLIVRRRRLRYVHCPTGTRFRAYVRERMNACRRRSDIRRDRVDVFGDSRKLYLRLFERISRQRLYSFLNRLKRYGLTEMGERYVRPKL